MLVDLRRLVETADFPDELERSSTDLFLSRGRIEVEQGPNVSAHSQRLRLSNKNKNVEFDNISSGEVNRLTRIVADDLHDDDVSSLVEYITAMSTGQITHHKKTVEVIGLTNKKIKFLLHKFLYTRHLPGYGVLDTAGSFDIVRLKPEEKGPAQHETLSPTMLPESIGLGGLPSSGKPSDMIEWQGQA